MLPAAALATSGGCPRGSSPWERPCRRPGARRGLAYAPTSAEAGHDIEHSRREAGFLDQGSQLDRGRGRVVAGLGHHRAARGQRGRELPGQQQQR